MISFRAPETHLGRGRVAIVMGLLVLATAIAGISTPAGGALALFGALGVVGIIVAVSNVWLGCLATLIAVAFFPAPFSVHIAGTTLTVGRLVLFATVVGWFFQRNRADIRAREQSTPLDPFMWIVIATLLASTIANLPRVTNVDLFGTLRKDALFAIDFFVFYKVVFTALTTRERAVRFLQFFTGVVAFTGVLGMFERFSGRNVFELLSPVLPAGVNSYVSGLAEAATLNRGSISRLHATFEQPLVFAIVLLLAIPLATAFALHATTWASRALWLAADASMIASLLFTASRGAYLVLGTMVITMVLAAPDRTSRLVLLAAVAVAVMASLTSSDIRTTMVSYLTTTQRGTQLEGSLGSRVDAFNETTDLLSERPFFGYGPGSFASAPESASRVIARVLDNGYLEHAAETGAVGTLALAGLLFASLVMTIRLRLRALTREDKLLAMGLIASVQAWILFAIFADEYLFNAPPRLFFALLGAIAALRVAQMAASRAEAPTAVGVTLS